MIKLISLRKLIKIPLIKLGVHAGNIVKAAAKEVGGGGGGRPDMAQAGGKNPDKLPEAFKKAEEVLRSQIN